MWTTIDKFIAIWKADLFKNKNSTIIWLHHLDFEEMSRKKARWELHKKAVYYFEQILEAAPYKTVAVWLLTSHLKDQQNMLGTAGEMSTNS